MAGLASPSRLVLHVYLALIFYGAKVANGQSPAPSDVVKQLLGEDEGLITFFEDHFGRTAYMVSDSSRVNRLDWMKSHRKFLKNEDLDSLIKSNASSSEEGGPLLLGQDVDLFRIAKEDHGFWGRVRIGSFFPSQQDNAPVAPSDSDASNVTVSPPILSVDHGKVHEAFSDGFEVVVYHMEVRSPEMHALVEALSAFWMVPVTASLHFLPNRLSTIRNAAPIFYAEDLFVVQLDGEQTVALYKDAVRSPSPADTENNEMRAAVGRKLENAEPEAKLLREGDVLYVPRGYALDWRTDKKISLHVLLRMETYECAVYDALIETISHAEKLSSGDEDNPLRFPLVGSEGKLTFADFVREAARISAEVTPEMQAYVPLSKYVTSVMDDAEVERVEVVLSRNVEHFVTAAKKALFEPSLDVLADTHASEGPREGVFTVAEWAHGVRSRGSSREVKGFEGMFQKCLDFVLENRSKLVVRARDSIVSTFEKNDARARPARVQRVAESLKRHGHTVSHDEL